jgi:hypothetical protein
MDNVVIGKRIPLGSALNSIAVIFAAVFPENAVAIMAAAIPATAALQVLYVNHYGVTTK